MGLGKSREASQKSEAQPRTTTKPSSGSGSRTASKQNDGISDADRATLQLKLQRDKLNAVLRRSATVLAREAEQARHFLGLGQREKALYCLKKKKLQEAQMEQVEGMLANVQSSLEAMDMARIEASVLESLRQGTRTLQELQKGMSPEEVERVMDEAFDAVAVSQEVTGLLAQQLSQESIDDDALLAELSASSSKKEVVPQETPAGETQRLQSALDVQVPSGPLPVIGVHEEVDDVEGSTSRERVAA